MKRDIEDKLSALGEDDTARRARLESESVLRPEELE
jgi:hypothetical protein